MINHQQSAGICVCVCVCEFLVYISVPSLSVHHFEADLEQYYAANRTLGVSMHAVYMHNCVCVCVYVCVSEITHHSFYALV